MNPIIAFEKCFASKQEAAAAAGLTREMMRLHRHRGFVTTRALALRMEAACGRKVRAIQLLGLAEEQPQKRAA